MQWQFKQYRVEWHVEVYEVDQYNQRPRDATVYYSRVWPTRELAQADLEQISEPDRYVEGRRISRLAPTSYHGVGVFYRETLVDS